MYDTILEQSWNVLDKEQAKCFILLFDCTRF